MYPTFKFIHTTLEGVRVCVCKCVFRGWKGAWLLRYFNSTNIAQVDRIITPIFTSPFKYKEIVSCFLIFIQQSDQKKKKKKVKIQSFAILCIDQSCFWSRLYQASALPKEAGQPRLASLICFELCLWLNWKNSWTGFSSWLLVSALKLKVTWPLDYCTTQGFCGY